MENIRDQLVVSLSTAVVATGTDRAKQILKILHSPDFTRLSAREKTRVLRRRRPWYWEDDVPSAATVPSTNEGVLGFIVRLDRLECLRTILPYVPEAGIPEDNQLLGKSFVELYHYLNDVQSCSWPLRQDTDVYRLFWDFKTVKNNKAFTQLAAELFAIGSCEDTSRCLEFLLEQAPDLVHHEVHHEFPLPLPRALHSDRFSRSVFESLLKHNAPIGPKGAGQELADLFKKYPEAIHPRKWADKAVMLIDSYKDEVIKYKDAKRNTLLHLIATEVRRKDSPLQTSDISKCFQKLLDTGVNAQDENAGFKTVLEMLLDKGQRLQSTSLDHAFHCAMILFQHFEGKKLPMGCMGYMADMFFDAPANMGPYMKWLELHKLALTHDAVDAESLASSGRTPWQQLLRGAQMPVDDIRDLRACDLFAELCALTLRKCDVVKCIRGIVQQPTLGHRESSRNDCCYLAVLRVLLRTGVDVMPIASLAVSNAAITRGLTARSLINTRLCTLDWLSPSRAISFCRAFLRCDVTVALTTLMSDVNGTLPLEHHARSLKFLSKRVIWRSLRRKDVDPLPLPPALKNYLMDYEME